MQVERIEVIAYPEECLHLHGKAISGLRHSHPLKPGENPDDPWHDHEGEFGMCDVPDGADRRGAGAALYDKRNGYVGNID